MARAGAGNKLRAVIYTRLSVKDPDGGDHGSLERQEDDCLKYAKDKGYEIAGVYRDEGVSATRGDKRKQFKAMLTRLETGTINVVLIWKLDRLARRSTDLDRFLKILEEEEIILYSVADGHEAKPGNSHLSLRILTIVAGEESNNIGIRVRRAKLERARLGGHTGGGPRPYGWTSPAKLKVVPEERKCILELVRRFLAGETCHAVARDWNERGITSSTGVRWNSSQLYNIRRSPRYAGVVLYQRKSKSPQVFKATWKPIVDQQTWALVEHELERRAKEPKNGGFHGRRHLLSGFLVCEACGYKMLSWKGKERHPAVYLCQQRTEHPDRCGKSRVLMQDADETAAELVLHAMKTPSIAVATASGVGLKAVAQKQDRLRFLDAQIRDLEVKYLKGAITSEAALSRARSELSDERDAISAELSGARAQVALRGRVLKSLRDWKSLTLLEQRAILAGLFDYIVIAKGKTRESAVKRLKPIFVMQSEKPSRVAGRLMLESVLAAQKLRRARSKTVRRV
jgi:DNA invertase Pin-like site-specific DNA recombinase